MGESYVPKAVKNAEKGSLLYRVTEKIAYNLHENNSNNDSESNWYKAQEYFQNWLCLKWGEFIYPLESLVRTCLESGEDCYKRDGRECDVLYGLKPIASFRITDSLYN